ncbi:MAG: beta-lactamase family protein, partial [Rhodothermales bacterium]|nr:beta-lactamase family protein [Rhodothermales bacterium]
MKHLPPLLILLLAIPTASAQPDPATLTERVDALVQPYEAARDFSGTILIAREGEELLRRSYGMANYEEGVGHTDNTRYLVGSVTKQFTAAAILLLEEAGQLSLDDPLSRFVAGIPQGDSITIHQLFSHTSGVARDPFPDYPDQVIARTLQEVVDAISLRPREFEPGARMSYSNGGYVLLAAVIEEVSGVSYSEFLRTSIFEPLGMH